MQITRDELETLGEEIEETRERLDTIAQILSRFTSDRLASHEVSQATSRLSSAYQAIFRALQEKRN